MRFALLLAAATALVAVPSAADPSRTSAAANTAATEARNKDLVLRMWHDVIDRRNFANAPRYIAKDYVQHSPGVGQGVEAVMAFLRQEFAAAPPLPPGPAPLTKFEFVIAEDDLVQLMFKRKVPSTREPGRLVDLWWYDTYRVKDGMIIEHWDSAVG